MVALPTLPTVRDMGRMALPLGSTLIAAPLGLERPVRWARTSGVLSPLFPTLNSDEVALLDMRQVQASNPGLTLARVVRELARLRISAIVIRGEVDNAARREAERSTLPLYALPEDADVARVARAIIRLVSDAETQEEAQAAALYRTLSQGIATGTGLQGMAATLQRLSGHSVIVTDLQGSVLAQAGSSPPGSVELTRPLFVADAPVAVLTLRDLPEMMDQFSRVAVEQGSSALALELVKIEAVEAAREGAQGDFVLGLLQEEPDTVLLARARSAEYSLDAAQWIIVASVDSGKASEEMVRAWLRRLATRAESAGWAMRYFLREASTPLLERSWQATIVLGGGRSSWETGRGDFLTYIMAAWQESARLTVAAGDPARGLDGLREALAEANDALSLGLRLFGPGRTFLHRDMGLYRLLRHLQGTDDLRQFLNGTLSALEAYDRQHDTELVATLRTLLDHGGNVSAAAKAMHLHRNSLVYRLERIRDIASLDPTDPDQAFTLKLALMLAPLR